ncbi:UNVERIFIED_CONTAM: hypothetical protein Sradi_3619800 [Sesamum radiatum]|uniref:DUF4283 domain-containing protein n=1 Tax=Sesamum radiatum TaxID=300843 RepID=A0AAW2QHH1_SESRA
MPTRVSSFGAGTVHGEDDAPPLLAAAAERGGGPSLPIGAAERRDGRKVHVAAVSLLSDQQGRVAAPRHQFPAPAAFIPAPRSKPETSFVVAVGYFLGKRPYFHHVNEFARSVWPMVREVKATANGFFFFEFKTMAAMEEVIEGGPWLFQGQAIILQKWTPGIALRKLQHTQVPVWIRLRHLPVELWTDEGLSTVASGVGKPLYPDAITRACTRLDFARCPTVKPRQSPVHVYVPKPTRPPTYREMRTEEGDPQPSRPVPHPRELCPERLDGADGTDDGAPEIVRHVDKGKELVLYNAFDMLNELDSDGDVIKGPISSPIAQPDD